MEQISKLAQSRKTLLNQLIQVDLQMEQLLIHEQNKDISLEMDYYFDSDAKTELSAAQLLLKLKVQ